MLVMGTVVPLFFNYVSLEHKHTILGKVVCNDDE